MDRQVLEKALGGKIISQAQLVKGTVELVFTDGTRFSRVKTCEGVIQAILEDAQGQILGKVRV